MELTMDKIKLSIVTLLFIPFLVSAKSTYDTTGVGKPYIRVPNCVLIEDAYFSPEDENGRAQLQARCSDIDDLKAASLGLMDNFPVYVIDTLPDSKSGYTRSEVAKFKSNNPNYKAGMIYSIDANLDAGFKNNSLFEVFADIANEKTSYRYYTRIWGVEKDYTVEEYINNSPLHINANKLQAYFMNRAPTPGVEKAKAFAKSISQ